MTTVIVPFLVYGLLAFVVSYVLVEYGQKYLYDEVTPLIGLKVLGGALLMALSLLWTRSSFETMFTSELPKTALLALAWVVIFVLIFRFQPLHGAGFALVVALLLPGIATLVVQSLTRPRPTAASATNQPRPVLRRSIGGSTGPAPAPTKEAK